MQKELKLRVRGGATDWDALADEEWLARFVRTLEAGRRMRPRWQLRALDDDDGRFGWEARLDRYDRTQRLTLSLSSDDDTPPADWTLSVESGPPERGPSALRGGEWLVGAALAVAAYLVARPRLGNMPALASALVLLLICGTVLPRLAWRVAPLPVDEEPDPVDQELLERVRRGAEAFAGFQLITPDWSEPELP